MKLFLSALITLFSLSIARADDVADAKAAFATMVEYQKTDDPRSLDLFTRDCAVTFIFTDGTTTRAAALPPEAFRQMLTKALAEKKGNKDVYEDVKYTQEGPAVRVNSTVLYADSGKRGPFTLLYVREKSGVLKVKEMKVTVFVPALPPPEA